MFDKTLSRFRSLRPPVQGLVFLFWIYTFTGAIVGVFMQIFLYQRFTSVSLNVVATLLFFTGILLGFVVCGYIAGIFRLNIKHGFFLSFAAMAASLLFLLHSGTMAAAYFAMFLSGVGAGLFWLTIHTFELAETKNEERDFYSSMLSAGNQILSLLAPACAVSLIWLSEEVFHFGTYTLLFTVTPFLYLAGFFFFSKIQDYRPSPIVWGDVTHFFSERKNRLAQFYILGGGFDHFFSQFLPALIVFFFLGTALKVGIYDIFLGILSALCVIVIAHRRTTGNRLVIFVVCSAVLIALNIFFGFIFTFLGLVIYTVVNSFVAPIQRVSEHVIDLETMDSIGRPGSDFYATMILRDFSLWFWRMLVGLIFLGVIQYMSSEASMLKTGLAAFVLAALFSSFGAYLLVGRKKPTRLG